MRQQTLYVAIHLRRLQPSRQTPPTILAAALTHSSPGAVLWAVPLTLATIEGPFVFVGNLLSRPDHRAMTATAEGVLRIAAFPDFVRNGFLAAQECIRD